LERIRGITGIEAPRSHGGTERHRYRAVLSQETLFVDHTTVTGSASSGVVLLPLPVDPMQHRIAYGKNRRERP